MKVLKSTKLIENLSDNLCKEIDDLFNKKKESRRHLILKFCIILVKNGDLEQVENFLKFLTEKEKTYLFRQYNLLLFKRYRLLI